ncbi:MAG TPA: response regulator transcription factor [Gemmatimonadales bacterium]
MIGAPIRVLVADDHAVVREGIRSVLHGEEGFTLVGEASTAAEAVRLVGDLHPDVAVLDVTMPGGSGLEAVGRIRRESPSTRVLMLSMHDNPEYARESVRAGAHGYLLKDSAAAELRQAVRAVSSGETYFAAPPAGESAPAGAALRPLTGRERDVLAGVALGRTNKEIAASLGISSRTVETHRESLMRKTGVRTVAGLTRLAMDAGLVPPSR